MGSSALPEARAMMCFLRAELRDRRSLDDVVQLDHYRHLRIELLEDLRLGERRCGLSRHGAEGEKERGGGEDGYLRKA